MRGLSLVREFLSGEGACTSVDLEEEGLFVWQHFTLLDERLYFRWDAFTHSVTGVKGVGGDWRDGGPVRGSSPVYNCAIKPLSV